MNSTTTSKIASSKKDEGKTGFKGKEILPPDRITAEDIHRALFNEYDMGCVSQSTPRYPDYTGLDHRHFDHHLF